FVCDGCKIEDFEGLRYHCEICIDYDLCEKCHDDGKESLQHLKVHAMERISDCSPSQSAVALNLPVDSSMLPDGSNDNRISEVEYLSILLDFCLRRFIDEPIRCEYINTVHFKERFADALNWTNGFIAKLSGSRLTGLVEQYFVELANDR
ncbi:unnamed protein product, partial [Adineta ricciae]